MKADKLRGKETSSSAALIFPSLQIPSFWQRVLTAQVELYVNWHHNLVAKLRALSNDKLALSTNDCIFIFISKGHLH